MDLPETPSNRPDDTPKPPRFGALQLPAINAKLKPGFVPQQLGDPNELVLVSGYMTRADYLSMKKPHLYAHDVMGYILIEGTEGILPAAECVAINEIAELNQLRTLAERQAQELDILKKAIAILSQTPDQ